MKPKLLIASALIGVGLIGYIGYGVTHLANKDVKMKHDNVRLELDNAKATKLEIEVKSLNGKLNQELQKNQVDDTTKQELDNKIRELEERNKALEVSRAARQAEKDRIAQAANKAVNAVTGTATASAASNYQGGGTKEEWMAAAGIPQADWPAVDSIVRRESSWNPNAVNASSGACGLGQQLPCGKWAGAWNDPVAALRAQHGYVKARYGGYWQAVAFWNVNHWY